LWVELLYPVAVLLCAVATLLIVMVAWLWYKHVFWEMLRRLLGLVDRVFYWLMDRIMGE